MLIAIASDHNGTGLKNIIKSFFAGQQNHKIIDLGPFDNRTVDYTDYADQLGHIVSSGDVDRGILICGTGVGMSIVANRHKNVRAVLAHNHTTAIKSREHNNSNVVCLGAWINSDIDNLTILEAWLSESWGEGRHVKRVEVIDKKDTGIVLTNGVFDILHKGHLELLKFAKQQGNKLVVAIDSDYLVKQLKGDSRPINNENDRKSLLESNIYVDEVIVFNSKQELIDLYSSINPSVIIKGSEWTVDEVRHQDKIPEHIQIKLYPLFKEYSTTGTIKNIKEIPTWQKIKKS
jgi:ribose 5-phosphate isomerase B